MRCRRRGGGTSGGAGGWVTTPQTKGDLCLELLLRSAGAACPRPSTQPGPTHCQRDSLGEQRVETDRELPSVLWERRARAPEDRVRPRGHPGCTEHRGPLLGSAITTLLGRRLGTHPSES